MNVRVTKFDRFFDTSKVCVGFYVTHPSADTGFFVDTVISMNGSDADMTEAAWVDVIPKVLSWLKSIQSSLGSVIGSTFTVPLLVVQAPTTTLSE